MILYTIYCMNPPDISSCQDGRVVGAGRCSHPVQYHRQSISYCCREKMKQLTALRKQDFRYQQQRIRISFANKFLPRTQLRLFLVFRKHKSTGINNTIDIFLYSNTVNVYLKRSLKSFTLIYFFTLKKSWRQGFRQCYGSVFIFYGSGSGLGS